MEGKLKEIIKIIYANPPNSDDETVDAFKEAIETIFKEQPLTTHDEILDAFDENEAFHFAIAAELDRYFCGNSGPYWRGAYGRPNEGDILEKGIAWEVGIFTFNIRPIQ